MTETWLSHYVYNNELILPSTFSIHRQDRRDTPGVGVIMAVVDLVPSMLAFSFDSIEMIAVELFYTPKVVNLLRIHSFC